MQPVRPAPGRDTAHVVVVGAGMVGLSTAWYLQERGLQVTVLDRSGVAAGSSWGNAGWISPGLSVPLADPSMLRYGIKALLDPDSPLYVPVTADAGLLRFLTGLARRCTMPQWRRAMASFVPVNRLAIEAYQHLEDEGVRATSHEAPIMAAFRRSQDSAALEHEIDLVREAGLELRTSTLDGDALRAALPVVAPEVESAIRIDGQRYINPGEYVSALAAAVEARGGTVTPGANVRALRHGPGGITVELFGGAPLHGDAVVLSTGAWLPDLARTYGVRVPLRAGRGYSFSVGVDDPPVAGPVYFPHERVACTPLGDRLRIGGTMEFRSADAALDPARIEAIVRSVRPLLSGVDWDGRRDPWVGARPVTIDSLPLVGATKTPGVWVHGGHGMWGMSLGPGTARLLAEQVATGAVPGPLRPFDPLR